MIELSYNDFLNELFKIKRFGKTPNLLVMCEILEKIGNPHKKLKFIHIAGTNGKGSTSNYISSILIEKGCKVGLFTSPYIHTFNERFKINNINIENDELAKIGSMILNIAKTLPHEVKQFDIITAIAMYWFYIKGCDYVVLEAGMGGRADSTNIVVPELSVITTIDLDHTKILGDTVEKIAYEKAGIIKENVPLVYYPTDCEDVLIKECKIKMSEYKTIDEPVIISRNFSGSKFLYKEKEYNIKMLGKHQVYNACVAIEASEKLGIEYEYIKKGLSKMKFEGRFEKISDNPLVFIDGGHNPQGAKSIVETVCYHNIKKPVYIVSVFKEKDAIGFLKNLKNHGEVILTSFSEELSHDPKILSTEFGFKTMPLSEIVNDIKTKKNDESYIFCGSIYQISQIKNLFDKT